MESVLKRYELIELPVDSTAGSQLNFPVLQNLALTDQQEIVTYGIEFFTAQELANSPTNKTVISMAVARQCYLSLYINEEQSIRRIPLTRLMPVHKSLPASAADSFWVENTQLFEYLVVDWNKSFIECPPGFGAGGFSVVFGVWYKKLRPGSLQILFGNKMPGW